MKKPRPRKRHRTQQRPLTSPHRPTISLCVIARDEEDFIGDCLASAQPYVDEIVVIDTGSTDATCEIARSYNARIGTFVWCDNFSAARNAAIDLATGDWIFMLDADERLQAATGPNLRAFVESNPAGLCFAPRIENLETESLADVHISFANRIFPRLPGLRYAGAIHEDLTYPPDPPRASGWRLDYIRITHLGYLPAVVQARDKFERNRRILVHETTVQPEDPLPWYYLGVEQLVVNKPAEAAEYLRRSLANRRNRPHWSGVDIFTQLIVAYIRLNDAARLESIVEEAEQAGTLSANARIMVAQGLAQRGEFPAAERQLILALAPNQPLDTVSKTGVGGWATRMDLARVYEHMHNPKAALEQVELVLADPELLEHNAVINTAIRIAVEVGDMASLSRSLEARLPPESDDLDGNLRALELRSMAGPPLTIQGPFGPIDRAIGLGDWQSAYDAARVLSGQTTPEAARILFVAMRLQGGEAPQAALNLLVRLHDAQPALPQVHVLLITVLKDLGRYDDALAANEILQTLLSRQAPLAAAA